MSCTKISVKTWDKVKSPIGIVFIIPGMFEHINEYKHFTDFLNHNGYIVAGVDIPNCAFPIMVRHARNIIRELKSRYELPVFIFGHGFGGFIVRRLLMICGLCNGGVCLSGIAKYPRFLMYVVRAFLKCGIYIFGANSIARKHNGISFSYIFYYSLIDNIIKMSAYVPTNIPLLIINGKGNMTARMTIALYNNYRENDLHNLTLILYPYASHNLVLNDEYTDVWNDILNFLNSGRN